MEAPEISKDRSRSERPTRARPGDFGASPLHDEKIKQTIETPGRLSAWVGLAAGLALALTYGLLIGNTELQTVLLLSSGIMLAILVIFLGNFWWAPLFLVSASGITATVLGFRATGFELGFCAVGIAFALKMAMRTMRIAQPKLRVGLAFRVLLFYIIAHCFVILLQQSHGGGEGSVKNIVRAYYTVFAPLMLSFLLLRSCEQRTVRPVLNAAMILIAVGTIFAIPVFVLSLDFAFLKAFPVEVSWLDLDSAGGVLRTAPVLLFFAFALWPATRSPAKKFLLLIAMVIALTAALASSGRIALASCLGGVLILCVLQKKWMIFPVVVMAIIFTGFTVTLNPRVLDRLPDSAHRALSPLNFSGHDTSVGQATQLSDRWHEELRTDSLRYWMASYSSFLVGHGYDRWDEGLTDTDFTRDFEYAKKMAIRMGRTENAFSSITNIFGIIGLLLYGAFTVSLFLRTLKARRLSPPRSFSRSMSEFSLVMMVLFAVLLPWSGGVPGWEIIFWHVGILSAREYLGAGVKTENDLYDNRPALPAAPRSMSRTRTR